MKFTFRFYTILFIVVSVDCGLVKQIFGNVKEDVHNVVEGTVNIIGKGTHKITEGLGVFLHRNEGSKFPGPKSETLAPNAHTNQISNDERTENTKDNNIGNYNKIEENSSINDIKSQNHNHEQPTPITVTVQNSSNKDGILNNDNNEFIHQATHPSKSTTESNFTTNVHEVTNNKVNTIHDHTVVPIPTPTSDSGTTTETVWLNGAELENILPTITHNDTHFAGKDNIDKDNQNTNELGTGENHPSATNVEDEKKAKCDNVNSTGSQLSNNKVNLVSDQMFFNDNKPKVNETIRNYVCADGLVKAANGDCLKQVEIDVRKKHEPLVYNIFQADGCPGGYARAIDGSCQKIIG